MPQQSLADRQGFSLVETLVVLSIITILLALFLPAAMSARNRARELICQNNLHQINIAMGNYIHIYKKPPPAGDQARIGGWSVELLPFLEKKNLYNQSSVGAPLIKTPEPMLKVPRIMRCPFRRAYENSIDGEMENTNYVLITGKGRQWWAVADAPLDLKTPWAIGPEIARSQLAGREGPHRGGFYLSNNTDSVQFFDGRE